MVTMVCVIIHFIWLCRISCSGWLCLCTGPLTTLAGAQYPFGMRPILIYIGVNKKLYVGIYMYIWISNDGGKNQRRAELSHVNVTCAVSNASHVHTLCKMDKMFNLNHIIQLWICLFELFYTLFFSPILPFIFSLFFIHDIRFGLFIYLFFPYNFDWDSKQNKE